MQCDERCCACRTSLACVADTERGFRDGLVGFPEPGEHSVAYWRGFDRGVEHARQERLAALRAKVSGV
jgi:hypothetical protein